MEVITFPGGKKTDEDWAEKRKQDLLGILDEMKERVEAGEILEIVAASTTPDEQVQIHVCASDIVAGVGIFDLGKSILASRYLLGIDDEIE